MSAAYFIATYDITDPKGYEPYVPGVIPLLQKHNCEILVADYEVMEEINIIAVEDEEAAMEETDPFATNVWDEEDESDGDPKAWKRNTGNGWAQNRILPISPDYISGQQAFNSTVVRLTKVT